jgi:hypothetical protein
VDQAAELPMEDLGLLAEMEPQVKDIKAVQA